MQNARSARDDQARKAKEKKCKEREAKRERDPHCEKEREKECERKREKEHEKELDREQEKKSILEDIEMTTMTAEERTEEMTDPVRGGIASVITTIRLAIAPLIPTMAFPQNQAQMTMTMVEPRHHIGGLKVDLTNLIYPSTFNSLKFLTINVRGLGTARKHNVFLHELNEKLDNDFFLLQEMHIYKTQADLIEKDFKGQCFWSFGISKSTGVAILVSPKFSGNILPYVHNTDVDSKSGDTFLLTDVDGLSFFGRATKIICFLACE